MRLKKKEMWKQWVKAQCVHIGKLKKNDDGKMVIFFSPEKEF